MPAIDRSLSDCIFMPAIDRSLSDLIAGTDPCSPRCNRTVFTFKRLNLALIMLTLALQMLTLAFKMVIFASNMLNFAA